MKISSLNNLLAVLTVLAGGALLLISGEEWEALLLGLLVMLPFYLLTCRSKVKDRIETTLLYFILGWTFSLILVRQTLSDGFTFPGDPGYYFDWLSTFGTTLLEIGAAFLLVMMLIKSKRAGRKLVNASLTAAGVCYAVAWLITSLFLSGETARWYDTDASRVMFVFYAAAFFADIRQQMGSSDGLGERESGRKILFGIPVAFFCAYLCIEPGCTNVLDIDLFNVVSFTQDWWKPAVWIAVISLILCLLGVANRFDPEGSARAIDMGILGGAWCLYILAEVIFESAQNWYLTIIGFQIADCVLVTVQKNNRDLRYRPKAALLVSVIGVPSLLLLGKLLNASPLIAAVTALVLVLSVFLCVRIKTAPFVTACLGCDAVALNLVLTSVLSGSVVGATGIIKVILIGVILCVVWCVSTVMLTDHAEVLASVSAKNYFFNLFGVKGMKLIPTLAVVVSMVYTLIRVILL